jgi:hypothetical protein
MANFKILVERMMKAAIDADGRARAEAERVMLAEKAVERAKAEQAREGGD